MNIINHNSKPLKYYINKLPGLEIRYLNVKGSGLTGCWIIATKTVIGHIEYNSGRVWLKDEFYLSAVKSAVAKYEQVSGREITIIIDDQFRPRPRLKWLSTFEKWMKPKGEK